MKRHRPQKPTRKRLCLREQIREFRRQAVMRAEADFKGTRDHGDRQEWGESRKVQGWSPGLVDEAIGGGPFALLRSVMREGVKAIPQDMPAYRRQRVLRAAGALAKIEAGMSVECKQPRYGHDSQPMVRRTYAPTRLRLPV